MYKCKPAAGNEETKKTSDVERERRLSGGVELHPPILEGTQFISRRRNSYFNHFAIFDSIDRRGQSRINNENMIFGIGIIKLTTSSNKFSTSPIGLER